MFLKYRPTRLEDMQEGLDRIRDRFAFDDADCAKLLEMWRELILSRAANATLIEDLDRPPGQRILQFAIIVFLSSETMSLLKTNAPAPVAKWVLDEWIRGNRLWLSLDEVCQANSSDGLNLIALHSGPAQSILQSPDWPLVATKITDYTPWAISGYRLNDCLLEVYTPAEYAYAEEYGMDLCREHPLDFPEPDRYSARLYNLTREQAYQRTGAAISELFHYHPPRFGFSPGEQELLWCGLQGETDEELAEQLNLALVTIKKRWRSIYERVSTVEPSLLDPAADEARRGGEKKRRLLYYLRHHLEELRPFERSGLP